MKVTKHCIFEALKEIVFRFLDNNCSTHAAGLTYFALLAIMPVLCCVLVTAKACGVDRYAREQFNRHLDALIVQIEDGQNDSLISRLPGFSTAEQEEKREAAKKFAQEARELSNTLFSRVEQFDIATFGWIGFGFLLWTVISSLASVENSFNAIFEVNVARPIWKRAYMYLFIMVILPVLATVAMSLPVLKVAKNIIVATLGATWLTKWAGDGLLCFIDSCLFRFVITLSFASIFFSFFFWMIPNCRVRWGNAFKGGSLTALFFMAWLKLCAVAQVGIARSSALYGSFAFLPIVLAWLYMSWQIVLLGACIVRQFDRPMNVL